MAQLKYRGILIDRIPRDIHSFPQKWMYVCRVNGVLIAANTQQSVKLQIGRVLNLLPPCDCSRCVRHTPATPIHSEACTMEMPCFLKPNNQCPWFEVRV